MSDFGFVNIAKLARRRGVGTALVVALLTAGVVVAAVRSNGTQATNVRLNDGAVWVTNERLGQLGRLNVRVRELDFAIGADPVGDVVQDGRNVVFSVPGGGAARLNVVDGRPTTGKNRIDIERYQVRSGLAAYVDPVSGRLWVGTDGDLAGAGAPKKPDAQLVPGSRIVITAGSGDRTRGKLLVVDPSQDAWYELLLDDTAKPRLKPIVRDTTVGTGAAVEATTPPAGTTPELEAPERLEPEYHRIGRDVLETTSISAVGDRLVFLDAAGTFYTDVGDAVTIPGEQWQLQQVGTDSAGALVASTAGLFEVPLGGGEVRQLVTASGAPSQPVRVAHCAYGAWSGPGPTWSKVCGTIPKFDAKKIEGASPNAELVIRVNQLNVALNSVLDGDVFYEHDGELSLVNNWNDFDGDNDASTARESRPSDKESERVCQDAQQPPVANDDRLGLRARPTVFDVLNNDDDKNCEPLAISSVTPSSGPWGTLAVVDNGQHVLFTPSSQTIQASVDSPVAFSVQYKVQDTHGNESGDAKTIDVSVVAPSDKNSPPALRPRGGAGKTRQMRTVTAEGQSVIYDVRGDWWDPDGDDLQLTAARPDRGDVTITPDGLVRFSAAGVGAGVVNVHVTMTDGVTSATEDLEVTVKPAGSSIPPVTGFDFVTVPEGGTATVSPLANDFDPNGVPLELLLRGEKTDGYTVKAMSNGNVEVTGHVPGVYGIPYEVSDGTDVSKSMIRLRVAGGGEGNTVPVAVPDAVKVRPDRVINVDVLANDQDDDGDVLGVLTAEAVPTADGTVVRASVVDRRLLQIEVITDPNRTAKDGTYLVRYVIDDGHAAERRNGATAEATADEAARRTGTVEITVVDQADDQPPTANDDAAVVRTGDVVAVPVLANDSDPDGDPIELTGVVPDNAASLERSGDAVAWTQGRTLYVKGGTPGNHEIQYAIVANGVAVNGLVRLNVTKSVVDSERENEAPAPKPLEVRALRGRTVRLQVPTFGIDPDGDAVTLLPTVDGLNATGAQGSAVELDAENPTVFLVTAGASAGPTDEFTYTVADSSGALGQATVRMLILDDPGQSPAAHDDIYRGKPGRTLSVNVLANDTSPQDKQLSLPAEPFATAEGAASATPQNAGSVEIENQADPETRGRISLKVPDGAEPLVEQYIVSDGENDSRAAIRVIPDPNAPNMPPETTPLAVDKALVRGKDVITVDLLPQFRDPDDERTMTLGLPAYEPGELDAASGTWDIPVRLDAQTVVYRVTDADGASTIGVVRVPGNRNSPPELTAGAAAPGAFSIDAGDADGLRFVIADITIDPDGDKNVALTATEIVVVGQMGTVTRDVVGGDDGRSFVYVPPPGLANPTQARIQFEVTDRPDLPDAEVRDPKLHSVATLEVVVDVKASSPPRITGTATVEVPEYLDVEKYDLKRLVVDDQNDPLTFAVVNPKPADLKVDQNGSVLTLSSPTKGAHRDGQKLSLNFTVTDGFSEPIEGSITVKIVRTKRAMPSAGTFATQEAERDVQFKLPNLLKGSTNAFPETPLVVVGQPQVAGANVTCSTGGDCTFLAAKTGEFDVRFQLKDAVERTATGSIKVSVKGKPLAPGTPVIKSVGDRVVTLAWSAADAQGSPISKYIVTASGDGTRTQEFTATGGEFGGLKNDVTYTFVVVAENALGKGDPSNRSSGARPDVVPDPPVGLQITDYGDAQLSLVWSPPSTASNYSRIDRYEVQIGGQTITVEGGSTTRVVTSLQNGQDYSFKMRAHNRAETNGGWGQWSGSSNTERPSRYPDPPGQPSAVNAGDGGNPRLKVTWSPPGNDGGRNVTDYQVCRVGGSCQNTGGQLQATFDVAGNTFATFTVKAINSDKNRNISDPSPASAPVTAVQPPAKPTITNIASADHQLTVTATNPDQSGCAAGSQLQYSLNGSSFQASNVFNGLKNGPPGYTVYVKAVLPSSCYKPYESEVATGQGTPYGPLRQPSISVSRSGNVITWNWNANRADDGRPGWQSVVSGACGGDTRPVGSFTRDFGYSSGYQSCTITVSATGAGALSAGPVGDQTPPPPPPPTITITVLSPDRTCPEDGRLPANWNGGACGLRHAWIQPGTSMTATCARWDWWNSNAGNDWYRTTSGLYIAMGSVSPSSPPAGFATC